MVFKIVWDNGHATGTLPGKYESEEDAKRAGEAWLKEMAYADPEGADDYSFEVIEASEGT